MNRIRELRGEMTLRQLATLTGTTASQIARLEQGERQLTQKWLDRLAAAFGVQPADLVLPPDQPLPAHKPPPLEVELRLINAKLDRQMELLEAIAARLKRRA